MVNLAIVIGLLFLVLQILNMTLSSEAKKRLKEMHFNAWYRVAGWREYIQSEWLFKKQFRKYFAFAAMLLAVGLAIAEVAIEPAEFYSRGLYNIPFYLVAIPAGAIFGWAIFAFIMREGVAGPLFRATVVLIVMSFMAVHIGYHWVLVNLWFGDPEFVFAAYQREFVVYNMAFYAQCTAAMFWWVATVPLVAVFALQISLFVAEGLLHYVTESKDGVLVAWANIFKFLKFW